MRGTPGVLCLLLLTLGPARVVADDLTGADELLCSMSTALACDPLGECYSISPWELNVPQFVVVDLEDKMLRTTAASGENRETPIKNLERARGEIYLQGVQAGRAFSAVIIEATGELSIGVAMSGLGVVVFGACTPQPSDD